MDHRTEREQGEEGLEAWWAMARASAPVPSGSLMARVAQDAFTHQPVPVGAMARPSTRARRLAPMALSWWQGWGARWARALRGGVLATGLASVLAGAWWVDARGMVDQEEAWMFLETEAWEAEILAGWESRS